QAGFGKIIFVINREMELAFRERIDQTIGKYCETEYVYQDLNNLPNGIQVPEEREKPWGTAHAVLSCKDAVESAFAVINADDFYGRTAFLDLADYLQQVKTQESLYEFCMVGYQLKNTLTEYGYVSRGICSVDPQGQLIEVCERTRIMIIDGQVKYSEDDTTWFVIPEDSVVSMNIWGFTCELFGELSDRFARFLAENRGNLSSAEYFLPEVVNQLVEEVKASVQVLPTEEHWFGVTYQDDVIWVKNAVQVLIDNGVYPKKLWG
ncbi:MAG TPA: sugar phosphate nucleotidyltransferase, partial [Anaerolineales bacterium]|nr:sugar phosphate nucleotidyltransferase [Anaerolineales bacterium]